MLTLPRTLLEPMSPDRHAELLSRALRHVDAHLADRLDAATQADHAAMPRQHFQRIFQARVGGSVGQYVDWCRLQRACALLKKRG